TLLTYYVEWDIFGLSELSSGVGDGMMSAVAATDQIDVHCSPVPSTGGKNGVWRHAQDFEKTSRVVTIRARGAGWRSRPINSELGTRAPAAEGKRPAHAGQSNRRPRREAAHGD